MSADRPEGICHNCYTVWRASKPRPLACYCWHASTVAQPIPEGWRITPNVGRITLERLRAEGSL